MTARNEKINLVVSYFKKMTISARYAVAYDRVQTQGYIGSQVPQVLL